MWENENKAKEKIIICTIWIKALNILYIVSHLCFKRLEILVLLMLECL